MLPAHLSHLPPPPPEAEALSKALERDIRSELENAGGWISFARYMELALYAPGRGYYSAGSTKLGRAGDFITAPEFSSLCGRTLARQVGELVQSGVSDVLELGAGSGALAADLLLSLEKLGALPERYLILEVSADLRERQRERVVKHAAHLADRVQWLDVLPAKLNATVIANEVLDAIPTHVINTHADGIDELGVTARDGFEWEARPASGELREVTARLDLPADYQTEVNLAARAFVKSLAATIDRGVLLFVDYGFPRAEYYHPQRTMGTLMCHYRHHSHGDPFVLVGLQDITAHVDFSAIAESGCEAGLDVLGYATQAQFLVNCGITEILGETSPHDAGAYAPLASHAHKLLSPAEMGELFKAIAIGKGVSAALTGFARGDRAHTL